jgi:dTDP-4-dehydrorhamnose reductase
MKILVIGSQGQLASELRAISSDYPNLELIFLPKEEMDITQAPDIEKKLRAVNPKVIINCSAYTAVDKAESEVDQAELINVRAVENLAMVSKKFDLHLIHISTDFVFDGLEKRPRVESDPVHPLSVYGRTKLEGENKIIASGVSFSIIRTSWLYSSFGNNFVKTMLRLGREKDQISVVNDQIGSPTYARDLAHMILESINGLIQHKNEIFHYSNEGEASWYDFAVETMNQKNLRCKVNPIPTAQYPTPAKRPAYSLLDKSKIKSTLGIRIAPWKDSLKSCLSLLD